MEEVKLVKKEKKHKKVNPDLFTLFWSNLYISAFTFGGGFVIISLMKKKYVDTLHWFEEDEMLDVTAIAQSCPGAIAVNASIVVGYKIAGILGALIAVLGTIIPPILIIILIAFGYKAFQENHLVQTVLMAMSAGVAAVVVDVVINMVSKVIKDKDIFIIILMILGFSAVVFLHINVILVIGVYAAIGVVKSLFTMKKQKSQKSSESEGENV